MPLFNPSQKTVAKLELIEQVSANTANSTSPNIVSAATPDKVFTTITNRGSVDAYVGFDTSTSSTNYAVKILPGGTYETPMGVFGDIYYWTEVNQAYTVASFKAVQI